MKGVDKELQSKVLEIVEYCIKKKDYEQLSRIGIVIHGFSYVFPLALSTIKPPPAKTKKKRQKIEAGLLEYRK